jgi:tetratricopeptide (TPR) repeat protein
MVSQKDSNQPPWGKKPIGGVPSKGDLEGVRESINAQYLAQFDQAIALGKAGDLQGAAEIARRAIEASEAKGGTHEASVILTFLPALYPGAPLSEFRKAAYRAAELLDGRPHCEFLLSHARFYTMQVELRADQKPAALKEAEFCVRAGKASKTHGRWLATAWRYYGMLLSLNGKMPEALLAMSNAIDLAQTKPTDDPLAIARAHDAMGRTLLEMGKLELGLSALKKAHKEFKGHGAKGDKEASATLVLINKVESTG